MSKYDLVFAGDPGKTTGYAAWCPEAGVYVADECDDWLEFCRGQENFLATAQQMGRRTLVVMEAFIITKATLEKSRQYFSLHINGVAEYLAHKYGADYKTQTPSDAKRFSTNERLKKAGDGWYQPTKGGHLNDALRHLYLALVTNGIIEPVI